MSNIATLTFLSRDLKKLEIVGKHLEIFWQFSRINNQINYSLCKTYCAAGNMNSYYYRQISCDVLF